MLVSDRHGDHKGSTEQLRQPKKVKLKCRGDGQQYERSTWHLNFDTIKFTGDNKKIMLQKNRWSIISGCYAQL